MTLSTNRYNKYTISSICIISKQEIDEFDKLTLEITFDTKGIQGATFTMTDLYTKSFFDEAKEIEGFSTRKVEEISYFTAFSRKQSEIESKVDEIELNHQNALKANAFNKLVRKLGKASLVKKYPEIFQELI